MHPSPNAHKARTIVGAWIRFKYQHDQGSRGNILNMIRYQQEPERIYESIVAQFAADAEHSSLLLRLLDGYDVMNEDLYRGLREEKNV